MTTNPPSPKDGPDPAALPAPKPVIALPEHAEPVKAKKVPKDSKSDAKTPLSKKRGVPLWVWIALSIVALGVAVFFLTKPKAGADKKGHGGGKHGAGMNGPMPVVAAKAVKGDIGVYLEGPGTVTPLQTVTVRSRVDGELTKIYFTEGEAVHTGDPLVEIDPRPYQVALEQAQGQLARDQALLDNAKVDLNRYEILLKQDSIPQQTYATQVSLVAQDVGVVQTDQAAVDNAKLNLAYTHITSPIDGRVGLRLVDLGNQVHASDSTGLLVITQLQPITVIFPLKEDDVPAVMKNLAAGQAMPVVAQDSQKTATLSTGTLLTVDNQIDTSTLTLRVKAQFANTDNALFPNQFVNARLLLQMKHGVVLVPQEAIQHGTQGTFAYVVKDDETVTMKPVTAGTIEAGQAEITKGIEAGDTVVIDGVDKLQEGGKVSVQLRK